MTVNFERAVELVLRTHFTEVAMVPMTHKLLATDTAIHIEQDDPPRSPKDILPTMYDLPSEDPGEPGLPDEFHDLQPQLLSRTLSLKGYSRENCFTASDLNLYYPEYNQGKILSCCP